MTTTPTNLPVPSESPRDLKFNAGKIDEFATSLANQYIDRFGSAHYTIEGLRWLAQQAIASFGYITLDSFEDGNTLTLPNQVLRLEETGEYYRWDGSFLPGGKIVPASSTPESTGGIGVGAWLSVGYAALKQQLMSAIDGMGDSLVAVKQPFSGSKPTTVHQKMREIIAINDGSTAGAEPDGVTDCSSALLGLVATVNPVVRLPFIPGTENVYYFSTFDPDALQGVTFDVDHGVKLSVPNDWLAGKPSALNIKFVRATQFIFRSLNTEYTVSPGNNELYVAKNTFLEEPSFDISSVTNINVLTDTTPVKILWPSSDVWVSDSYNASGIDFGQLAYLSGDDSFHIGVINIVPGDELITTMYVTNTPQLCAIVRHTDGYSGIYASYAQTGATMYAFEKRKGITGTSAPVLYPMLTDHASYSPVNCEWKIRANSFTSFDILLNGFVITTIKTSGYIIDAGFGGYFNVGTSNPTVRFINPVKIKNNVYTRNSFMAVKVFGDSISANRVDCWPHYLKKELEFAEGMRAWDIVNKAVPGDTSAGQLAIMQSEGVADANVVVIAVGTNDAQGMLDLDQYKSNLTAMVNICQSAGKPVILVKFGLWYPQALAGTGVGQNTGNYQFAARYRSVVSRVAAEKGVKLVELTDCEGPLTAYYINTSLAVNMVGKGDGVVHDNIHPTSMATMLIARKIARAIMGYFAINRGKYSSGMLSIASTNNWFINASDRPVRVDISKGGAVILSGVLFKSTGSVTDGTQIAQIPKNISPSFDMQFPVYADTSGVSLRVLPTGEVKVYGATTSTNFVGVSGLSWVLKE
ncbi:GDSL-type esterase/lipase family protein [Kosakonia sp. YIM B13611]|uniref:GDSL-type esterase/lipase family protein n=1 Tax=unclassified Kosakonia TaxID=2632876 RepID=UPI0036C6D76C